MLASVAPPGHRSPAVAGRTHDPGLPVPAAVRCKRAAADRHVPEVGICGIDRGGPGVAAVEALIEPAKP
jgi:hypothetical protein